MSSRPNIKQYQAIEDGDMSADIVSEITILQMVTVGVYTFSWSGSSPVGNISVEISNDYMPGAPSSEKPINAGTWTQVYFTLNGSSVVNSAPVSGNTGTGAIEFTTGAYAIRTKYTATSGTGLLQAVINCKVA
jgi:hypothetical protein